MKRRNLIVTLIVLTVLGTGSLLAYWKHAESSAPKAQVVEPPADMPLPADALVVESYSIKKGPNKGDRYLHLESHLASQEACSQWAALWKANGFTEQRSPIKATAEERTAVTTFAHDGLPPHIEALTRNEGWYAVYQKGPLTASLYAWDVDDGALLELVYSSR